MRFKDLLSFRMGNEQSAPTPRKPPNKLSKPRTNNNSNLNILNTKSAPASRRNSVSTNNDYAPRNGNGKLPSDVGDVPGKRKAEPTQKKRLSLFRSRSEKGKDRVSELDHGIVTESAEPSHVDSSSHRWSRQPLPRGRGYSFVTEAAAEPQHYDLAEDMHTLRTRMSFHQAQAAQYEQQLNRLSLVAELPSPQPLQLPQTELKGLSRGNSFYEPSENGTQTSTGGSRRGSDAEKYGPIRRRSLLQHGIATRPAFVENDSRRSLPSQAHAPDNLQSHYCSPSSYEYFPPAELVVLGPNSAFAVPGPRTETPTDLDYRHIGAFKLGSLRITNGTASPTPSRDGRAASLGAEEDYILPGQARKSIEKEQRHGLSHRSNTLSVPAEARKVVPWVVRSESPLRQSLSTEFEPLSIDIPDPSFAFFDFQSTEILFKSTHSPTKSLDLAHEYQQEIASSPFSFENSPIPSLRLQSTSKHTAIEDDLFAPEPNTPNLETSPRMPRSFDSGYEAGSVKKPKGPREKDPKPLAKADSGYSSIISFRSFKKDAPAVPPKDPPTPIRETFVRVPSSTYSVNSSIGPETSLRSKRSLPALPVEQIVEPPPEPAKQKPSAPLKSFPYEMYSPAPSPSLLRQSVEKATVQAQPHLQVPKNQSKRRSAPVVASTARETREDIPAESEKSVPSVGSSSIWQRKKLSKKVSRPSSFQPQPEPVFTVQAFRSPSEVLRIPVPSVEIRRQLDERVESFPVASFPNTTSGTAELRRTASKETLGTIFSVGSAEVRDEVNFARLQGALPAIPTEPTIQEDSTQADEWAPQPNFDKRHTFQASAPIPALTDEWNSRNSFQAPSTRTRSRNRNSVPVQNKASVSKPLPQNPAPIQERTPRKSFQLANTRDPSPAPIPTSPASRSFQKPPARDPSPTPAQDWHPRRSFQKPASRDPSPAPAQDWHPRRSFQKPASRDPSPISTGRASLHTDFETHITSYDAITSSLGRSPYELAFDTIPNKVAPTMNDRAKSMTAQLEADAAQRFANSRSVSQESQASIIVRPRRSYESIKNSNPWSGDNRSAPRLSMRGPPLAHANGRRPYSFQQALSRNTLPSYGGYWSEQSAIRDAEQASTHSYQKQKSAPPVSMTTQRNTMPTAKNSQLVLPPSLQAAPNHAPPQPPAPFLPPKNEVADAWKNTAGAWAERKKSAGEALSARTSLDMTRSSSIQSFQQPLPQPRAQELRGRRSVDANSYGEGLRQAGSTRPSLEYQRPHMLHSGKSFDTSQQRQTSWTNNSGYDNANSNERQYYDQAEYHHTYGSADFSQHNKENFQQYAEPEYYETEPEYQQQTQYLPETIHQRKTSTSEMLVLDRFSAGLDYGYEPGLGLVGSAGVRTTGNMGNAGRKSMRESMQYGVDFSDVPVILQRVRAKV